jgi:UDP-glucose 4-epimerase
MRVAVTGGSGQLGALVVRRLLDSASVERVVSFDKRKGTVRHPKLDVVEGDVRDPGLEKHFAGCDAVVHLAFLVTVRAPRELFWGVNVEGSKNVFRAALAAGSKHIVYSSSVAAYGVVRGHPSPIVEETPRRHQPEFPYSATKFEVEAFLDGFEKEHKELAVTRIRPTILVGRKMEHALGDALARRQILAFGDAPFVVVWDEDVADAILLALEKRAAGAFNVSADEPLPPLALARAVGLKAFKVPRGLAVGVARISPWLERIGLGKAIDEGWAEAGSVTMLPSSEKAKRVLGWKPSCPTAIDVMRKYLQND